MFKTMSKNVENYVKTCSKLLVFYMDLKIRKF